MLAQRRRLSGKSTLGKALQYALSRWDALARYLEDGRLSIDNNLAERQLRGIAVTPKKFLFLGSGAGGLSTATNRAGGQLRGIAATRKNFRFLGSDAGGQRAAIVYTVAETAKL